MAAIDKLGIINIIDKHFDALNGEYSPYVIEGNSTVFSFFKKLYDILKDGSIFENNLLLKTYEETIKEILVKLEQIENRKIYQYNFANSSDINDIKNSFTEMLKYLWKYVDRHFPQTLTENEQKVGYYNKNFGYHIEKEIEIEHTEESYEQISNEELQAGPQEGEEYYIHPIASTEVEYNPVTELEPQAGVEYYTNPVASTREDYSLTQDSEPQPGAEYYVRSIIETIEIYNLAEESEPKADETYYTHPINEREVYTEESEPQQGKEYYVHPVSSIEENYSNVTEEEPQAGVEYYVHPTVEREVYNLVQDKSSVSLPYNEYYKHGYRPLTSEEIAAGLKQGYEYFKEITVETPSGYELYSTSNDRSGINTGGRECISEFELVDKTQTLKPEPGRAYFRKLEPDDPLFEVETYDYMDSDWFIYGPDGLEFKDDVDYYVLKSISAKKYLRLSSDGIHYEPVELVPWSELSPSVMVAKIYTKIDTSVITEPEPNTVYYAYNKSNDTYNRNPEFAPIEEIVEYPAGSLTEWDISNGNEYYTKEVYNIYDADRPTTTATTTEIVPVESSELENGFADNVAYYTYDENTHVPCTENDFDITTSESEVPSVVYERVTTEEKEKLYNVMDDVRALEDIYGYEIYKKVDNEYVHITEEDLEDYPNNPNSKWYNYPDPDLHMIGLKLDETFYKKISINYNERGLIPIDKSTYSQPITRESISKIYVNPLPEEGIRYVDNTATITRIPATSFEQYEAQYGRPIYKLVDGEYVPIESGDMVKNEDNGAWYLDPQYTYFSKETRTLPYFRESTENDFDYTGDFENASFKEGRNYRYLNGLEVASGYIERGEKYGMIELYTSDLRVVIYADFYTNGFYQGGYFNESDRDVYYEVDDRLRSQYLGEEFFNKLYQSTDLITYEKATTPNENIFKGLKNFNEWFRYDGTEYISSSTFLDEPHYISLSTLSASGAYVFDNESYRLVTENDLYEDKVYKLDISKQYYFHELTFENNRYFSKLFEMSQNLLPTTTTTTETTFKEDIDYYTKSQVEELDTNNYIKSKTNGSVTLISGLNPKNNNIIKTKDIYTGEDTIYIRKGTGPIVEMYKQTDAQEAPQLLFRHDFGTLNVRSLSATNGKLFVFGNGIIIDYFKNDQNIWTTTAYYHDDPNTTAYDECAMCGNDVVLLKQITEEGENKGKYEVYYYDYSTRSLKKTDDIEPESRFEIYTGTSSSSDIDSKYQNLGNDIIVTSDTKKTYIFNKRFTKIENTLDEYTSSPKYSSYKYKLEAENDIDWSSVEFGKLTIGENNSSFCTNGFVSTITKNENNDNYNGYIVLNDDYYERAYVFCVDQNNCLTCCNYNENDFAGFKFKQCHKYKDGSNLFIDGRKLKDFVAFFYFCNSYEITSAYYNFTAAIYSNNKIMSPVCSLQLNEYSDTIYNREVEIVDSDYNEYEDLKLCLILYNDMEPGNSYIPFIFEYCKNSRPQHSDYLSRNDFYKPDSNELRIPSEYNYKNNITINKNCLKIYEDTDDDLPTKCLDFDLKLQENPSLGDVQLIEDTYSKNYIFGIKENDRYRIYKMIDGQVVPTEVYIEPNDGMTYQNMSDWVWIHLLTLNNDYENFLILINATDLITNKSSFEEGVDYFTKTVTKTYDNSSYVLAENLEEGVPYFTKTIVKEVVDDSSYVPAGDLQSFDDDIDYFTKTIAYTYDDSSYEPAGNLQSFDENTQYFNKIVTNTYDTSSYVPAENLQVFDDGASYFTKSITYTYDDSSYEPITDLQSFDENTDYFTKKITVVTETQTISTYESDDGTELKFNGYKEDIIIGGKLLPIYNENGKVEYDNDVYIKMLGVDKVYPEIIVRLSKNEEYKYYSLNDAILTIFKNDNYKKFSTNDVDSKNVLIEYSFDNGFVVNDNNEYESPNGLIYELFLSALRSIVDSSRNYFMEKLKKYFYDGIVSRYREKKIEDKRTSLVIRDDGLNSNGMMVVPKVYEKLGGKGGSIGSITTLDFDKKTNFDSSEYIRMVFDDAYYNTKTNNIELYFDLSYMNGFIKSLSNYRGIDGFINNYAMRFDKDANIRQWLLINKKEIEEAILKNLLFAIEPCFWPDYTNDESWNKNFYVNNAAKLQKVYYYNNKTYSKEDELLKDLNLSETNKKFVEYSVIRKQRNISIDFDNDKFIILLKNEDRLTIDKELFDENDSYFERNTISNEEYNEKVADYFEKLNLEKLYLGSGYINVRKVPQKFKDNGVSELVDCEYVNKNVFNESEEFSSILDDREFIILHNVNTKVSNGNNVFYDTENNYSDIEFPYELEGSVQTIPIWKSAKLYKKKHYFELVCSNFMKKNNIEAIKQIRVMQPTNNKNRYLFNVRSIENRTTEEKGILFDINFKDLEDYKISYVLNNTLHIPNQSVLSTGINEDTLRLSSLPDNEKFDYYSDSSLRITYGDEKFPSEEQYVFGDTMYIKSPSNIVEEEELLILAERSKEYKVFTSEYIMILEPGLETNKLNIADGEYINVQILDFLQVSPGAINVELPQLVYDNEGNGSVYVKTVEPEPLIFRGFYKKFELIDSSPSLLVERRNMVNFNINKQNLTIKKELNKKITFKENLKFSKQMALRIFDESPKLELFENKWLKCKRLNGSLECKVSNMGELQLEKIERVYLEFPEFSDKNTILQVILLPEEARLINSVIKLLPNNYTFRNDKNAVYIYDSNGNSVDTLYKNFYLDCDVLKQGEKIIEGEKFINFEFKPSREYFNGTDRWMQLINNQPYVIPLIEGMDQELKKFEVAFY